MTFLSLIRASLRGGALAIAIGIAGSGGALAQEPIRIGTFLSVTGPAAFLGDPEQKTLEMVRRAHQCRKAACSAASCSWSPTTTPATPRRRAPSPSGCSSRTRST